MRYVAFAAVLVLAVACSSPPGVEGDLTPTGAKGAYMTVTLVRNSTDILAAVDAACQAERTEIEQRNSRLKTFEAERDRFKQRKPRTTIEQVAISDSVEKYRMAALGEQRALAERPDTMHQYNQGLLRAATDTELQADGKGHYKFTNRKPGQYLLYADVPAGKDEIEFVAPVTLGAKGTTKLNLDQSAVSTKLRCR